MIKLGGTRLTVKPAGIPAMAHLYDDLPNFGDVLDDIKKQIALCAGSIDSLELTPMLLLGDPGIGKTHFARRIAELLSTGFGFVSMSSLTAGWILSGSSSQWKNAKPGKVFETFLNGQYANPLMVVDEIDKAGGDSSYDALGALYTLLEHDTATRFIDEFVEVPIDASSVFWIATANDVSRIPEPLLNRMNVYEIESPDREAAVRIAQAIYREIRNSHDWGRQFPPALGEDTVERLSELSPREMRRAIMNGFGNAKLAGHDEIEVEDVMDNRAAKKSRIGF
jgi:ATP-dependent Lon protease